MFEFTVKEILIGVGSVISALVAGWTYKTISKRSSVVQKNNIVGGDIAGRDINKK